MWKIPLSARRSTAWHFLARLLHWDLAGMSRDGSLWQQPFKCQDFVFRSCFSYIYGCWSHPFSVLVRLTLEGCSFSALLTPPYHQFITDNYTGKKVWQSNNAGSMQDVSPVKRLLKANGPLVAFLLISRTLKDLLMHLQHQLSSQSANCLPVTPTVTPSQFKIWGAQRNLEQGFPDHTEAAQKQPVSSVDPPGGSRVMEAPTLEPARDAEKQKERRMQQLTPGEASFQAEEVSYNVLCSRLHPVGRTTTLHSQNHLCKTPGSTVAVFHPKSSSVHLTSDIQDKKMKNCIASTIFTYLLFYSPSLALLLFVYLTGQVYSGLLGWHFSFAVLTQTTGEKHCFQEPCNWALIHLISHRFFRRVMQVTAVR